MVGHGATAAGPTGATQHHGANDRHQGGDPQRAAAKRGRYEERCAADAQGAEHDRGKTFEQRELRTEEHFTEPITPTNHELHYQELEDQPSRICQHLHRGGQHLAATVFGRAAQDDGDADCPGPAGCQGR